MKRELSCSYIYTDGTLVQVFDEYRDRVKIAQTVDITLGYCKCSVEHHHQPWGQPNHGRVIINRYEQGIIDLLKGGKLRAVMPSLEAGSTNTQSRGIKVQIVQLTTAKGLKLNWSEFDIMHGNFVIQDDNSLLRHDHTSMTPGDSWGGDKVWKVRDLRKKEAKATTA